MGILSRHAALGTRSISTRIYVHPDHDSGCFRRAHEFLRPFRSAFRHALVLFDRQGCGQDQRGALDLAHDVEVRLQQNGWERNAAAICLDPELEAWVWSRSPHVADTLGWAQGMDSLRSWLDQRGVWPSGAPRPTDPKKAVELTLRETHRSWSASIFLELAMRVSLERCVDPAFQRLRGILQSWFPRM